MCDESPATFLVEVESITNSRPMTVEFKNDIGSETWLCPSNSVATETDVDLPPAGGIVIYWFMQLVKVQNNPMHCQWIMVSLVKEVFD